MAEIGVVFKTTKCDVKMKIRGGNKPILLNDPTIVWVVRSGNIALFAVNVKDGVTVGSRRYLFSCEPGEALFGVIPDPNFGRSLLAVALVETELIKISLDLLEAQPDKTTYIEGWIRQLNGVLADSERGLPQVNTSAIQNGDTLLREFSHLHTNFLYEFELLEQREQAEAWQNLQAREQFNNQATALTLEALESVLPQTGDGNNPTSAFGNEMSDKPEYISLYLAARAVGQAMGIPISPPALSENLQRVREPIEALARASRIRIRRVLLTDNWWQRDSGPLLAYTRQGNRPVALLQMSPTRYQIFDPESKTRMTVNAHTAAMVAPTAYTFYQPLPDRHLKALDLVRFALQSHGKDLRTIIGTGIAITLLGMVTPQAIAILIDSAIPDANRGLLVEVGVGLLATAWGGLIFQLAEKFALLRIETLADMSTQAAVWDRLLNLPVSFFRQYSTGDLRSRVSAISTIRRQLSGTVLQTLFTSAVALPNLGLLFYYDWQLALFAALIVLVNLTTTISVAILNLRNTLRLQELEGTIFGLMVQLINGVAKLRVSGAEERAFAHWGKQYTQQQKLKLKVQQLTDSLALFNQILPTLSAAVLFAAAVNLIQGSASLSTGTFLAFNAAFGILISGTTGFGDVITNLLSVATLWERIKPIMEADPEVNAQQADPGPISGRLALDHVTFSYPGQKLSVLDDVTIHAQAGEFIAIVGPSGSGKSTILRLLLGFETPESGQVYYDGQELGGLNIYAVRRQLGVVLQSSQLNAVSILENIAGAALITIDEAWEACRQAGLAEDIAAMPMGMHTVISEGGSNLSGGQRQRLLIARALVSKPRILLLDEATSALDNRTQTLVIDSLEKLQVTRIVIAHRLSTIRNADRIYVLESGKVVQEGRFDELIKQPGLFATLMQRQIT